MEMKQKVFLEVLPTKQGLGRNYNKLVIDWNKSIGYKVKFIYNNIEDWVEIVKYDLKQHTILIKYKNKEYSILTDSFRKCRLGEILKVRTSDFKIEIGTRFKDSKRDIAIINREHRKKKHGEAMVKDKWYKYTCNVCDWTEGWISEDYLLKGYGCSCCSGHTVVKGINTIWDTNPWMIPFVGEECAKTHTSSSQDKVFPTCPDCGRTKDKKMMISTIYKQGISCLCGDGISYPNKFAISMLEQLNIKFKREYSPEWISPRRYDFYFELDNKKYILEMDGILGHGSNTHPNDSRTTQECTEIDNYKDEQARLHGIEVIRIDCEYLNTQSRLKYLLKSISNNKKLNNLFDLSIIDFNKCNEFACSNIIKNICTLKRDYPNLTSEDISKITSYSSNTIRRWLKIGNEVNWCYYNPKEELIKVTNKLIDYNVLSCSKPVEIFKDGICLGIFLSARELERVSYELFKIKLLSSPICKVCNNKKPQYKGYTFKYISKEEYEQRKSQENLNQVI